MEIKNALSDTSGEPQSLLPFDQADFMNIRVLPAEFSRMIGTSKQSVSRWIREGKLSLGIDGRLNPNAAMRQLAANCDPSRFRQRMIKQAVSSMKDTVAQASRAGILEQELHEARLENARLSDAIKRYDNALENFAGDVALDHGSISRLPTHEARVRRVKAMMRNAMATAEALQLSSKTEQLDDL